MTCAGCHRDYRQSETGCPHCGAPNPEYGFFQTSSVIVSDRGANRVYQSVAEIPAALRTRLERYTNGENSGVILIADRRGRSEIAKALRALPERDRRRVARAVLGETGMPPSNRRPGLPVRRKTLLAALLGVALAAAAVLFTRNWH
jgi:hypothetical protein